jgi:hypothetical protein
MGGEPEHVESTAARQAAFSFVASRSFEGGLLVENGPAPLLWPLLRGWPARSGVARSFRGGPLVQWSCLVDATCRSGFGVIEPQVEPDGLVR